VCNGSFQALQVQRVSCWHQVIVVDDLDEWLDARVLVLTLGSHSLGDLLWVSVNAVGYLVRAAGKTCRLFGEHTLLQRHGGMGESLRRYLVVEREQPGGAC
jgi:hypothetical protein